MPVLSVKSTVMDIAGELTQGDVVVINYTSARSGKDKQARGHVRNVYLRLRDEHNNGGITIVREDGSSVRAYTDGHIEVGKSNYTQGYVDSIEVVGNCNNE